MSLHDGSGGSPIPTAVLVGKRDKSERPAKRKAGRSPAKVPWVQIVMGGSVVWVIVLVVMAIYAAVQERSAAPVGPAIPANVVVLGEQAPLAAPVAVAPRPMAEPQPAAPKEPIEPAAPGKLAARQELDDNLFMSCEQIGTKVRFMKDPPEAFKRAKDEGKMVFMVHLSGNLEDKDFT